MNISQAVNEASRCLLCHDAPCSKACPAGTDPARFIRKLRLKNTTGAIRTIKSNNILGGVCGRLCPSARLCEKECVAKGLDNPIRIGEIQSAIVEHSWDIKFRSLERPVATKDKIAIVGAGPSGLSCAASLVKDGYQITIFEEKPKAGGVLRYGIPEHRLPSSYLESELEDLKYLGVEIRLSSPIKGQTSINKLFTDGFRAIYLAVGLWQPMISGKGNSIGGVMNAQNFLYSLRTENFAKTKELIKGKKIAVIGGGSVAIDCAMSAAEHGAKDVCIIYRRSYMEMPAEGDEKKSAMERGICFHLLNRPVDYVADNSQNLKAIKLIRTTLGNLDTSDRRVPEDVVGSEWELPVHMCIEAIGSQAPSELPHWYPMVTVTKNLLIQINTETGETSFNGIFAGGDIVHGPALIVEAVADGKLAANSIRKYLEEK